jgi:hypothetical protein
MFLPFTGTPNAHPITGIGQIHSGAVDELADAARDALNALWGDSFPVIVAVTQVNKDRARGLLPVVGVKVDSVVDIQRSRRASDPQDVTAHKLSA